MSRIDRTTDAEVSDDTTAAGCYGAAPMADAPEPESAGEAAATEACCGAAPTAEARETPAPAQLFGRCC